MLIDVYLPIDPTQLPIAAGSGIVGTQGETGLTLDYEGNLVGYANVVTFADRVGIAAGRHEPRYPTVARITVTGREVARVGYYDPTEGQVEVEAEHRAAVARWCGLNEGDLTDQLRTTFGVHERRRAIRSGLMSTDPQVRFAAEHLDRTTNHR